MKELTLLLCSLMLLVSYCNGKEHKQKNANRQESFCNMKLPEAWKVFYSDELNLQNTAALRYDDSAFITAKGEKIEPVILPHNHELNLSRGKKLVAERPCALAGIIEAEKPSSIYIGCGADWWFDVFCNGQYAGGTGESGNLSWPPKSTDWVFKLDLKGGKNDIVFLVRSGKGSWKLTIDFMNECNDPDIPSRVSVKPGIAYGPYLTEPGQDKITINYVLNGRQPMELEYRPLGETAWKKIGLLRAGQLIDEVPVMRFFLTGLHPDTVYEYRALLRTPPIYRASHAEPICRFRTWSNKPSHFTFAVIGDTHRNGRDKPMLIRNLQKNIPAFNKAALLFHVGDLNSHIDNIRQEAFNSLFRFIPPETILVNMRGNHDFDGCEAQQWIEYFGFTGRKSYGLFRLGGVCFLVLDSGHHLSPQSKNSYQRYTGLNQLDTLLEEQKEWLKQAVRTPEFQTAEFRIVLSHVAPHSHEDGFNWTFPRMQKMTEELFKGMPPKERIDLWIAGHTHHYKVFRDKDWCFPAVVVGGGFVPNSTGLALLFSAEPGKIIMKAVNLDGSVLDTMLLEK